MLRAAFGKLQIRERDVAMFGRREGGIRRPVVPRWPLSVLIELAPVLKPVALSVQDDDLVPERSFRLRYRRQHVRHSEESSPSVSGAEYGTSVLVSCGSSADFAPDSIFTTRRT